MRGMGYVLLVNVVCSHCANADHYWMEHASGWHWYQDPQEMVGDEKDNNNEVPMSAPHNPSQVMDGIRQQVKLTLDQAILNPTLENVREYIALQNQISAQAHRFAQVWQTTLLNDPMLDYSLQHPTNAIGTQVYLDQQQQAETQAIRELAQHSGLVFFYRSTCPYCQRFAPIVKHFSDRYGITVLAVTTDQISLPEFPDSRIDQGQAAQLGVTLEPALFALDPYQRQMISVGFGLMSEDELRERILVIARQQQQGR